MSSFFHSDHLLKYRSPANRHSLVAAFTLIELLVVISIISLLISILLPALGNARKSAVTIQCAVKLRSMGTYYALYTVDNRDFLPPFQDTIAPVWHWYRLRAYWQYSSTTPTAGTRAFVCPANALLFTGVTPDQIDWTYVPTHSYLWRANESVPWSGAVMTWSAADRARPQQITFYSRPSSTYMLAEGKQAAVGWTTPGSVANAHALWTNTVAPPSYVNVNTAPNVADPSLNFPHLNGMNLLFYDGHVKLNKLNNLRADSWMSYWGG